MAGGLSWALVACTALVVLSGVDCEELMAHAELGPSDDTLGVSAAICPKDELGEVAGGGIDGLLSLKLVAPASLIESGRQLMCQGWAKMGHCNTKVVQESCAASCATKSISAATANAAKAKANANATIASQCPSLLLQCREKLGDTGVGLVMKKLNDAFAKKVASAFEAVKGTGYKCVSKGKISKRQCFFDGVGDNCDFEQSTDGEGKIKGKRVLEGSEGKKGKTTKRRTSKGSKRKKSKGGRRLLEERGTDGLAGTSGVKACNKFWKSTAFQKKPNGFKFSKKTFKKPVFVCHTTKIASSSGRSEKSGDSLLAALDNELREAVGEVSQMTVGRRGKASTVRRGGGSFVMPVSSGGSYQGNYEEQELGEGKALVPTAAIASSSNVEGLAVCEDSKALRRVGATCVAAFVANRMVREGLYQEGNDNHVCHRGKGRHGTTKAGKGKNGTTKAGKGKNGTTKAGKGKNGTTKAGKGKKGTTKATKVKRKRKSKVKSKVQRKRGALASHGKRKKASNHELGEEAVNNRCNQATLWREANKIRNIPESCKLAAITCRPPSTVAEGNLLKAECLGALLSM